jgi:hypothetical protein
MSFLLLTILKRKALKQSQLDLDETRQKLKQSKVDMAVLSFNSKRRKGKDGFKKNDAVAAAENLGEGDESEEETVSKGRKTPAKFQKHEGAVKTLGRKFGSMHSPFLTRKLFDMVLIRPQLLATSEDRFANKESLQRGLVAELFDFVPENMHELMRTQFFGDTVCYISMTRIILMVFTVYGRTHWFASINDKPSTWAC